MVILRLVNLAKVIDDLSVGPSLQYPLHIDVLVREHDFELGELGQMVLQTLRHILLHLLLEAEANTTILLPKQVHQLLIFLLLEDLLDLMLVLDILKTGLLLLSALDGSLDLVELGLLLLNCVRELHQVHEVLEANLVV